MIDHPLMLLAFVMCQTLATLAFLFIAVNVIPRSRLLSKWTRAMGVLAALSSGAAHASLAALVLFSPDLTARRLSSSPAALALHALVAISLWVFMWMVYGERIGPLRQVANPTAGERPAHGSDETGLPPG